MAESDIEAKQLHTKKLEELLLAPIFDIFHVQRAQLEEKTESQNSLLFHFKASMAKVRTWNASTVKTFVDNLVTRFPVLGEEFDTAFEELQQVTCSILNASSNINHYEPVVQPSHTYIHEFISACADAFISFPEWFAVDGKSAEYQTCKNNAKVRMAQCSVVPNTVMTFIKTSRRQTSPDAVVTSTTPSEEDANSDMDIFGDNQSTQSDQSDVSSVRGPKKIKIKSGVVQEEVVPTMEPAREPAVDQGQTQQAEEPDDQREVSEPEATQSEQQEEPEADQPEQQVQVQDSDEEPEHNSDTEAEDAVDSDAFSLSFDGDETGSLSSMDTSGYSDSTEYTSSSLPESTEDSTKDSTEDSVWSSDDSSTESDSTSTAESSDVSLYWESVSDGSFYTAHESETDDD